MTTHRERPYRVLIADDSAFMRRLIAEMIATDPAFTVAGVARNGVDALRQCDVLDPDVITLDLEMPQLDGLQVLEQVMLRSPRPVVVLSAGGARFGDATMRALSLGAVDFILKPSGAVSLDLPIIRERLLEALRVAVTVDVARMRRDEPVTRTPEWATAAVGSAADGSLAGVTSPAVSAAQVVVVAASTGGPRALTELIPALPSSIRAAVLVAQHLPKDFTRSLARHLDRAAAVPVTEAVHGEPVLSGRVYIAPGKSHMCVTGVPGAATLTLVPALGRATISPSADVLFTSAATTFGGAVTGVVLTGMGRDGAEGARAIRQAGGRILVQDRDTSAIFGMPNAVLTTVGADSIVPIQGMAAAISDTITGQDNTLNDPQDTSQAPAQDDPSGDPRLRPDARARETHV